jgi:hypothetical protein
MKTTFMFTEKHDKQNVTKYVNYSLYVGEYVQFDEDCSWYKIVRKYIKIDIDEVMLLLE